MHGGALRDACLCVSRRFRHSKGCCEGRTGLREGSLEQPATPGELPKLASLTKAAPSPLLRWQLLDVLYAYCLIMRLYNGEPMADPQVGHSPNMN